MARDLICHDAPLGRWNLKAPATFFETVEVQVKPADATVVRGHRLEQSVAVGEPAIGGIDAGS